MDAYGETGPDRDYEGDHLISIELGGDPGAVRRPEGGWTETNWRENIWPQPYSRQDGMDATAKDRLENYLRREVCGNRMSLADAQSYIRQDWVTAYHVLIEPEQ
jgi:hypothetical protein